VRHLAWLNATPDGSKKSRLKSFKEQDEDHNLLNLPEIVGASHLLSYLMEVGVAMSSGMGLMPLSWQEIDSWLRVTELPLTTWEKIVLRELSETYVNEYSQASEKDRPAPYVHRVDEIDRAAVSDKLKSVFRSLKKKPEQHE
jgi:hypothetical protein